MKLSNFLRVSVTFAILISSQYASAQAENNWLPELQFSKIQNREFFLGDRWSYMATGSVNSLPVIALHGLGDNSMAWINQYQSLGKKYRFIGWNAPGYMMSSELAKDDPDCADYAFALGDFLDSLGLNKAVIVGNSFGSRVGQCFSLYYPDRVIALILIGPSAGRASITESEKNDVMRERQKQISNGSYEFPGQRAKALIDKASPDHLFSYLSNMMRATNKRAFLQGANITVSLGYDPVTLSKKITVPVLLIAGKNDSVTPNAQHAIPLKENLENSQLIILKNTGHLPHLEQARRVNHEIIKFLKKHTGEA